jgi:hypothetical protein
LKGIPKQSGFGDREAMRVLSTGLKSAWVRANKLRTLDSAWPDAHSALSVAALASHVNNYHSVRHQTPYVSLTAGLMLYDGQSRTATRRSAWQTALEFATKFGTVTGYVFECWVVLPPNPAPELPGFGEDVRDLNLHASFAYWHPQGEVAAKLGVPARQIRRVVKFGSDLKPQRMGGTRATKAGLLNRDFVPPERVSNIRRVL